MKLTTKLLAASAVALSMSATAANAAVWVGYSLDGGSTITTAIFGDPDGAFNYNLGALGGFETVTVSGDTGPLPGLLHASTVDANNAGGTGGHIVIFVTHTDITADVGNHFVYQYANTNQLGPATVDFSTFIDDDNGVFTGDLVASGSHPHLPGDFHTFGPGATGSFSVTHRFDVNIDAQGSAAPSASLTAVPEPGTWALMIVGFGGAGALLRRRRALAVA